MFECAIDHEPEHPCVRLTGRLDGLSAPELQRHLSGLVDAGHRTLDLDLSGVTFLSSAGLRILLILHQSLVPLGGSMRLQEASPAARQVLELSGFLQLFSVPGTAPGRPAASRDLVRGGTRFRILEAEAPVVPLSTWGSAAPLSRAGYGPEHMVTVAPDRAPWGCYLGATGADWREVAPLAGEGVAIGGHHFLQPPQLRPVVDYHLAGEAPNLQLLHGFAFPGGWRLRAAFEGTLDLDALVAAFFELLPVPCLGFALLAESAGLLGMHLRRPPVDGGDPFDPARFPDWFQASLDPTEAGSTVMASGVASAQGLPGILPESSPFHVHGVTFGRAPLARDPARFEGEVDRLARGHAPLKVQHLLGGSSFRSGLVAVAAVEA